jgi:hypothetical protein
MSEISFDYTGNPPEIFKKMLFDLVRIHMKDIKEEVLKNGGKIRLDYISDDNIELRADCMNPETRMKMTLALQSILTKFRSN